MDKDLTEKEVEMLVRLNSRAMKIILIEDHFLKNKLRIDTKYLDTLTTKEIDKIINTHCIEK